MAICLIALGSNLGRREHALDAALAEIEAHTKIQMTASSRPHSTLPVGGPAGQGEFLNAAALLHTTLPPEELASFLRQVEDKLGRTRSQTWAARTIDLDVLLYDDCIIDRGPLVVPHPRMTFRRFVLEPAAEIAAKLRHPLTGSTVGELLHHLNSTPRYAAIAGSTALGAELAKQLHRTFGGRLALGPPSPACSDSVSFLRLAKQYAELLKLPDSGWLVSDFWPGDLYVEARRKLTGRSWIEFQTAWNQIRAHMPQPKLVIVLTAQPVVPSQIARTLAAGGYRGPQIHLETTDFDAALRQAAAALEASA